MANKIQFIGKVWRYSLIQDRIYVRYVLSHLLQKPESIDFYSFFFLRNYPAEIELFSGNDKWVLGSTLVSFRESITEFSECIDEP